MATTDTRRWWALGALMLAVLAVGLDGTILSVALPTLAGALRATETDLQWFSSGYLLVLAAAMLPAGLLGDRLGRRRVMLAALALFGAGSAACALAPSANAFIAARLVLGLAGAGVIVMALSALTVMFDEDERPRAVGVWAAANFLALPVGPILGGWLLTHAWWGWVFLINVPVALVGLIAGFALVPESRAAERPGLDPIGVLASTAGLVGLAYGFVEAGQRGWTDPVVLGPIAAGLVALVAFFLWERRLARRPGGRPLVDLELFRSGAFTWGVLLSALMGLAMIGVIFTLPQYFQAVVGTDAMGSGVRLLPLIAGLVAGALPADRVAALVGRRTVVAAGFALLAAGMAVGATTSVASSGWFVAAWMVLVGAGTGLTMSTAAATALSALSPERSGVGSAVMQAVQKVGGPFGVAIMGSVLSTAYQADLRAANLPQAARDSVFGGLAVAERLGSAPLAASVRAAFVHGMDAALLISAGIALAGIVLTVVFLPGRTAAGAETPVEERPVVVRG
jgi:EmrB/QacA subfamily drug resistance transporter